MTDFNRRITVNEVIRRALGTMGLVKPANVSDATDATTRQMLDLLTECGQELIGEYDWQDLVKTHTFTTTSELLYDLPTDWERFIDDTGWNNTGRIPLLGPMNPQQWRMLQARQLGGTTLRLQYIIREDKFNLYFVPNPAQEIAIDYISRGWVIDGTDSSVRRDYPLNSSDIVVYSPRVIVPLLKWKWRDAKGFDTTSAKKEYEDALKVAKYSDKPHTALPLSGRSQFPYLGYINMPDTGLGR